MAVGAGEASMSNKNEPLSRDRREVVRVGGAAAFGAIAAWLTTGVSPVRAEALAQGAPVIDRLTDERSY